MIHSELNLPPGPLLVIIAHPDDEILMAALIAAVASAGWPVQIVCFTKGEAGIRDSQTSPDELAAIRVKELQAACRALGAADPIILTPFGNVTLADNDLHLVDPDIGVRALLPVYEQFQPRHVLGLPDDGLTGHPGHTWASQVALAAHAKAAPTGARFWQPVATADWATLPLGKFMYGHQPLRIYPPNALALQLEVRPRAPKIAAIQSHRSQSASLDLLWPAIIRHEAYIEVG